MLLNIVLIENNRLNLSFTKIIKYSAAHKYSAWQFYIHIAMHNL